MTPLQIFCWWIGAKVPEMVQNSDKYPLQCDKNSAKKANSPQESSYNKHGYCANKLPPQQNRITEFKRFLVTNKCGYTINNSW